jgi:multicomponent Na+:H+ antiporter subunit F
MNGFVLAIAAVLLANITVGLLGAARSRHPDAITLAVLLFGSTGVAILLLLAEALAQPALRDVALVFVALAASIVVVLVHRDLPVP